MRRLIALWLLLGVAHAQDDIDITAECRSIVNPVNVQAGDVGLLAVCLLALEVPADAVEPVSIGRVFADVDCGGCDIRDVMSSLVLFWPAQPENILFRARADELFTPRMSLGTDKQIVVVQPGEQRLPTLAVEMRADAYRHAEFVNISFQRISVDARSRHLSTPGPVPAVRFNLRNGRPRAVADAYTVSEGGSAVLDVMANDSDPNGDPIIGLEIVEGPTSGVVEVVDGQVRYTHDGREAPLEDRFSYRVLDFRDASAPVDVTLTINPVNDPPVGVPETYVTREDVPLVIDADLGVLVNDIDVDSDVLIAVQDAPPAIGDFMLNADGGFIYVPAPDFNGEVTFAYRVDDDIDQSNPATTVTIVVLPDEDPPRPGDGQFATPEGTPIALDLGGVDPEGVAPVLLIEGYPDHGHLVALRPEAGQVTFVPPAGFTGAARFSYRLTDRAVVSEVFEAVIQVGP